MPAYLNRILILYYKNNENVLCVHSNATHLCASYVYMIIIWNYNVMYECEWLCHPLSYLLFDD